MSSEYPPETLWPPGLDGIDLMEGRDRVARTAGDRPHTDSLPALLDPAADDADRSLAERRADVEQKHRRIAAFLDAHGLEAVVLGRADSVAWFTSGGDLGRSLADEPAAALLLTIAATWVAWKYTIKIC